MNFNDFIIQDTPKLDELIEVWDDRDEYENAIKRHFSHMENNMVYCFSQGKKSTDEETITLVWENYKRISKCKNL